MVRIVLLMAELTLVKSRDKCNGFIFIIALEIPAFEIVLIVQNLTSET